MENAAVARALCQTCGIIYKYSQMVESSMKASTTRLWSMIVYYLPLVRVSLKKHSVYD